MKAPTNMYEGVQDVLRRLKLPTIRETLDDHIRVAQSKSLTHLEFFNGLLEAEIKGRELSNFRRRLKSSKLPMEKILDSFDFAFQPSLPRPRVLQLKDCRWVANAQNVMFAGQSGTGKTHLAMALALEAIEHGYQAYFVTVADLLDQLKIAELSGRLLQLEKRLLKQDVIVLDELGYVKVDQRQGNFLFRLVTKAYEKRSLIITTNKDFSGWGEIFDDPAQVAAMLDRLLHHCILFKTQGQSYRIQGQASTQEPRST